MRFYKRDGSCKINQEEDCEFGWWLCDILVGEENVSSSLTTTTTTATYRDFENGNLILELNNNTVEESIDLTYPFECNKKLMFEKHEPPPLPTPPPFVEIHFPVRAHKSQMSPEGYVKKDELNPFSGMSEIFCCESKRQLDFLKFEDFTTVRFKLSNMISSYKLEGRLLISLIDVYRFQHLNLINDEIIEENIEELKRPSRFTKFAFPYHYNVKFKKSLLNEDPEIFRKLADLPQNTSEKFNYTPLDLLKNSKTENFKNKLFESIELLEENLVRIEENVKEMQMDLISLRIDFQVEDERTLRLLKESRKLKQELNESNYLNEVLLLLMGQAEKIKSNKWPFKICVNPNYCNDEQLNLII